MFLTAVYSSCCYKSEESKSRCLSNSFKALYCNALIMEEADAGLLSHVVCNIALCRYTAFVFNGFAPQWEMFIESINRLLRIKKKKKITGRWHYLAIRKGNSSWNNLQTEKILCEAQMGTLLKSTERSRNESRLSSHSNTILKSERYLR